MRLDKEKIKRMYIMGLNYDEIADRLNYNKSSVRSCINRNFSNFRFEHRKNRDLNKSMIKAINQENNSFIGNRALLKWNRQSFNYNKNGNLVFNERRGKRPKDLPKSFSKKDGMINNLEESGITMSVAVNHLLK